MKTIYIVIHKILFFTISVLFFFSCTGRSGSDDTQSLVVGEVVHDTLNTEQIDKIKEIHNTFVEVDSFSLEQTINDFKRDKNPDNEISIWLSMAKAYKKFTINKPKLGLNKKKEAYRLILMRSMESESVAKEKSELKFLSDEEVKEILGYYDLEAKPITISK
ncbi:hypothetical protein [Emticicia aquatilis]|nr:hypothetical protein [Emticicia aquatilis]